jgi:hypothetical protein
METLDLLFSKSPESDLNLKKTLTPFFEILSVAKEPMPALIKNIYHFTLLYVL